jgi:hypothetical protein
MEAFLIGTDTNTKNEKGFRYGSLFIIDTVIAYTNPPVGGVTVKATYIVSGLKPASTRA